MPTSNSILVDTSGWGCYLDRREAHHQAAVAIAQAAALNHRKLVTSNYIIAELVVLLASRLRFPRPQVYAAIDAFKASSSVEIMHIDAPLDATAWALLKTRADKDWSLVDASSFVIMQTYGMTEALTTDHHFTQAGFAKLLATP